jgi:hypothetical protein
LSQPCNCHDEESDGCCNENQAMMYGDEERANVFSLWYSYLAHVQSHSHALVIRRLPALLPEHPRLVFDFSTGDTLHYLPRFNELAVWCDA